MIGVENLISKETAVSDKKWYVYMLRDPDTKEPFYIGKGSGNRVDIHEQVRGSESNKRKEQIVRDIQARGKEVLKEIVAELDDEEDAYAYEKYLIKQHGSQLTNIVHTSKASEIKQAPPGFYTAREAREVLDLSASTFTYYVKQGRIKRYIPPHRREGYYKKSEINQIARNMASFLNPPPPDGNL